VIMIDIGFEFAREKCSVIAVYLKEHASLDESKITTTTVQIQYLKTF